MAVSSSLESIFISPRTPKTPRIAQNGDADSDEVELALLGDEERERAAVGVDSDGIDTHTTKRPLSTKDKKAMVLLCVLCECNL
jgi:PAT family acetyl-CoA transporter-like MFS transporter 1